MIPDTVKGGIAAICALLTLLVGLAAGGYLVHLYDAGTVATAHAETASVKAALNTANDQIKVLGSKIDDQNTSIAAWKAKADENEARAKKAAQDAQAAREKADRDAANLLAQQPKPGEGRCEAASRLIREELAQ